jgi:ribosomal protein S27AE
MAELAGVVRRRQYCGLCGQVMFEFYRSPDGHYGVVEDVGAVASARGFRVECPTCGARYRLLDRADATGQTLAKI